MKILPIPEFPGYFADAEGEIYSLKRYTGEFYRLRQRVQNSGYLYVRHPSGWKSVHRLVCSAFHGESPSRASECRHLNGRKRDNRARNLIWGSKNQNFLDKVRHGQVRLTPQSVKRIREYLIDGAGLSDLARVFNVSYHTIYYIAQGMTWRKRGCGLTEKFRAWQATLPFSKTA